MGRRERVHTVAPVTSTSTPLVDDVRAFLDVAIAACGRTAAGTAMRSLADRLDQPLRVAIAGRAGSGKSTLLNALLGDEVAATRGSARASVPAWYRFGAVPRVLAQPQDDDAVELPCSTDAGFFDVDLPAHTIGDVSRLVVELPSQPLHDVTLVDLPGGTPATRVCADALIYVLPHLTADDAAFLEAFHGDDLAHPLSVNAIAVLSRVDELGVERDDAMAYARRLAHATADRADVRRLCQTVVPVAGLLAQGAATLRDEEVATLRVLASGPVDEVARALASAERFTRSASDVLPSLPDRQWLLLRLGLFGVRTAVSQLRDRPLASTTRLSATLVEASGLDELRRTMDAQLGSRPSVLKARSVLADAKAILRSQPPPRAAWLLADVERIESAAHELNELRVLHAIDAGVVHLGLEDAEDARRLLGVDGADALVRLGLDDATDAVDARAAADLALRRWRRRTVDPTAAPLELHASATIVRTCEGILEDLS
jgi:energy-coupling factor transporter ATP-binding protein EcfA2